MATALTHLAQIAMAQVAYAEAHTLYQRSLDIYRNSGDQGGIATALTGLGSAACALHDNHAARHAFREALQRATTIAFIPLMLTILVQVSALLHKEGQSERALEVLALVLQHPASDRETRDQAQHHFAQVEPEVPQQRVATAVQRGQAADLAMLIAGLLVDLSVPAMHAGEQQLPANTYFFCPAEGEFYSPGRRPCNSC